MPPMPSLRDPETLHPLIRRIWEQHVTDCRAAGLIVVTVFCYRSALAQERLYQIGRRGIPGEQIVTKARGGRSWHNVERNGYPAALAYDIALMTADGKRYLPDHDERWTVAGKLGRALGLSWCEPWMLAGDYGHYQLDGRGTLTLDAALAGRDPAGGGTV